MINNVVLVGRLTRDPELRYTNNNVANVAFTLAVNRTFTNQQGQREADFINIVIWRKSAEVLSQYAKKGMLLGIVGRIQTRNYENQQGQRVYVTEVVADNFQLLESRKISEQRVNNQSSFNGEQNSQMNSLSSNSEQANQNLPFSEFSNKNNANLFGDASIDISDDDLPF
ncbi:MAG: single-stranded DNA-binding protein [Streptococcaceae bacterium]|jgi:single-strand DNA-binding protein|nr:single-stranded DNA-binding protein [Streptococcaceae bacterium]